MKKLATLALCFALLTSSAYAAEGEMGSFGGISTGIKLETLTERGQAKKKTTSTKQTLPYKENVYLSGKAEAVEGTIEIKPGKGMDKSVGSGSYSESYVMKAQNKDNTVRVSRTVTLETQYIYEPSRKQATKTTTIKKWTETVTVNGQTYTLDDDASNFTKSILEDYTPGVLYYRGDVHYTAVYTTGGGNDASSVTVNVSAPIYGYEQALAKSETQKRTITIDLGDGTGYVVEETPTFTVYRDIEYAANEPTAISMVGNYKELIRSEGALSYNIIQGNNTLNEDEYSGMMSVEGNVSMDQLSYPTNLKLGGHPAETQIKKMYSMKIFDELTQPAATFSTNKVVTKKEYIKMLINMLQIELPEEKTSNKRSSSKVEEEVSPFIDLSPDDPYYKYAIAAYNTGLVDGGRFNGNSYLTRELMYVLNVRAIGLERLGLGTMDAYTPFVDDNQIGAWAKSSIYAASKLGIITPDNGYVFPKKNVTYAECATFLDQFMNYLRYDLQKDYNEKMLI